MAHDNRPQSHSKYDPHFAAIGRVTETWAQLEFYIDQAIWQYAQVEQALGACITSQLIGINNRMRAITALARARGVSEGLVKELSKLGGHLGTLQHKRHRAVHDPRMINTRTGEMDRLQITADHTLQFGWQKETAESLMDVREEIGDKIMTFQNLHARIAAELNALPDTAQPLLPRITGVSKGASTQATDPAMPQPPQKPSAG